MVVVLVLKVRWGGSGIQLSKVCVCGWWGVSLDLLASDYFWLVDFSAIESTRLCLGKKGEENRTRDDVLFFISWLTQD